MPFIDPWLRDGQSSPLEHERRMYEQTGNVLHAVRALEICSEMMRGGVYDSHTLPVFVLDLIDRFVTGVREMHAEAQDTSLATTEMAGRLLDALGLKRAGAGVRSTAFSDERLARRNQALATMVWKRKNREPTKSLDDVIYDLAQDLAASASTPSRRQRAADERTIWAAWSEWKEFVERARRERHES